MKNKYFVVSLSIYLTFVYSAIPQNAEFKKEINPINIDNIKIQDIDLIDNFVLFHERVIKPDKSGNNQIMQIWRKDSTNTSLKIVEETKQSIVNPVGSSCLQKWYREGKKEKIEINVIICTSESEMEKTINLFTNQMFASQYDSTETPIIGEKSWIPKSTTSQMDSYSLMFKASNVFVRIYINLNNYSLDEIIKISKLLARKVENNIIKEQFK